MKTHYTEEEKKHVCNICGYRFAKIKFLKNHLTTHSDVRQFACEVRTGLQYYRGLYDHLFSPLELVRNTLALKQKE